MAGEEFGGWEREGFSARRCACEKGCVVLTVWERRVGGEGRFATGFVCVRGLWFVKCVGREGARVGGEGFSAGNCVCERIVVCKL